jgi:hypothetical protein
VDDRTSCANLLKVERATTVAGRRRRYDEAFKDELTEGIIKKQKAISGSAEGKVQGVDPRRQREWVQEKLQAQLVCCKRVFGSTTGTYSQSEDAARLGKPAKDVKTYSMFRPGLRVGCWMANQACHSHLDVLSRTCCRTRGPLNTLQTRSPLHRFQRILFSI